MTLPELFAVNFTPCSSSEPEWDALIQEASEELLLPAMRSRFVDLGWLDRIPPQIDRVLAAAEKYNRERNLHLIAEALQATRLLNSIGIRPVALKGIAYLLNGTCTDPAIRYLLDIDLLIPARTIPEAVQLFKQHGYLDSATDILAPLRHHAPTLCRTGPAAPIELHHRIALGVCDRLLPAQEVFARATPFEIDGAKLLIPSPTDLANHLILHSQLHNAYKYRAFPPLRALYDLLLLTRSQPIDWETLTETYRSEGQYLTLALHLKEAERVLGMKTPIDLPLGSLGNLRWYRRRVIRALPLIRFFDPTHMIMAIFRNRVRMLSRVLECPEHRRVFARAFFDKRSYRRLLGFD